ncbi:MAG: hypothetical protein RIR00_422, partial [Pseudomonadota bacterium]
YGAAADWVAPLLAEFGPEALRDWAAGLGIPTFVGSSGRVFPEEMKAAPLLRAWLHRLRGLGVQIQVRWRWLGWDAAGRWRFATPAGEQAVDADAVVLALGGGSWARLGSDGAWLPLLAARGIATTPLRPANCGFDVAGGWSAPLLARCTRAPLKNLRLSFTDHHGKTCVRAGEAMLSATGIEGGLIYALSAPLRDSITATGRARLSLDLMPERDQAGLERELARPRGRDTLANHLRRRIGLTGAKAALLREAFPELAGFSPAQLAAALKALPLNLVAPRPLDEAISSAGGLCLTALTPDLMLKHLPGVFCAGEMLDWEAPTGGYLLTACFASGHRAGNGVLRFL